MIIPDINLLIYAHNEAAPRHAAARAWWEDLMNREALVGLPWAVVFGFVRLVTHPSVMENPLRPAQALDRVDTWFTRTHVEIVEPGPRHLSIARDLFTAIGIAGALSTDAHLAAIAIEHQAWIHSNDADFARFPGLRWTNPISK